MEETKDETIARLNVEIKSHLSAWEKDSKELMECRKRRDYSDFRFRTERAYTNRLLRILKQHGIEHPARHPTNFEYWLHSYANKEIYR